MKKIDKKNVFIIEPYQSIIHLLYEFKDIKGGLEAKYFRYALIKNHDAKNNSNPEGLHKRTMVTLHNFFGNKLDNLIKLGLIKKDCISSRKNLDNFLRKLSSEEIEILSKNKKKKVIRYKLNKSYYNEGIRIQNKEVIDLYHMDFIFQKEIGIPDKFIIGRQVLYGLSKKEFDSFNSQDRSKIIENLNKIEQLISEIDNIKNEKIWNNWKYKYNFLINKYKNNRFRQFAKFLYLALLNVLEGEISGEMPKEYSVVKCEYEESPVLWHLSRSPKTKRICKFINWVYKNWSDDWFKKHSGLTSDQAEDFLKIMRKEAEKFHNTFKYPISFSRYYYIYPEKIKNIILTEKIFKINDEGIRPDITWYGT